MNVARCIVNRKMMTVDIKLDILSGRIDEKDISDMRCPVCNAPAHIVHDSAREWHFRARHEPDCDIVIDGREHKVHKINEMIIIDDLETILHHRDHAPTITPKPKPGVDPGADPHENLEDIDDIDTIIKYGTRYIRSVGGIYSYILANGLDADLGNGLIGRDLLLTARALRDVRRNGMAGTKVAITKRFSQKTVAHPFDVPDGYTCLSDAFATDIENAVFFIVKLSREDQNSLFRAKIMGDPDIKDRHRNILLLGEWREFSNDYYNVFISNDINTHCYKFVNFQDLR